MGDVPKPALDSCIDGVTVARNIRARCRVLRRTVKSVCLEAKVTYRTYCGWRNGENDPNFTYLRRIYAVLERHERGHV